MPTSLSSLLWGATRTDDRPLNVLSFSTHERYQGIFGQTPHRYYLWRGPGLKEWNHSYAPLPWNTTILQEVNDDSGESRIPPDMDFDVILSQSKFGQFTIAQRLSKMWQVPLISLEHILPQPDWTQFQINKLKNMRGHVNVFLSEYSTKTWGWEGEYHIVGPSIDTDLFTPEWYIPTEPCILSVVNQWKSRDTLCGFSLWRQVTKDLPVFVLGENPGLSRPARDTDELIAVYRQSRIFLNTSLVSTCPYTLLEAMSVGKAVVSTATSMIPQIIKDGVNGFCSNDAAILRKRCQQLLEDEELCRRLGGEARKTMEEKFSFKCVAPVWEGVLRTASDIIVTGE